MKNNLTHEEKIDYIYNQLRKQKQYAIFKVIFKLIIILFIALSIFNFIQNKNFDDIQAEIQTQFSEFSYPIIQDMIEKNTKDMQNQYQEYLKNNQ
jgi:hypothetical protein